MTHKTELVRLLQERTLSNWERRKRRLQRIPMNVVTEALRKARKGEPLTEQEYIVVRFGFLPGETIPEVEGYPRQEGETKWTESSE